MGRVEGKVAFITGAARGQGRSHAVRLADEGADIIAVDVCEQIQGVPYAMSTPEDLEQTVYEVEKLGRRIIARVADVRDPGQLESALGEGLAEFGRLDIVCANAGIFGPLDPLPDIAARLASFRLIVDVNLTGAYSTLEVCRQPLIDTGGGSVILTSSLAGLRRLGAGGGYAESKHGMVGLMRTLAGELAPYGIRVNSIHPTNVDTPMIMNDTISRAFRPDLENPTRGEVEQALSFLNLMPVPFVDPGDVSDAVLWLASDESRYITGVTLPVDAGGAIK